MGNIYLPVPIVAVMRVNILPFKDPALNLVAIKLTGKRS